MKRIIITGGLQSGKSTLAEQCVKELADRRLTTAGIIARGLWKDDLRSGFILRDLRTDELIPLAERADSSDTPGRTPFLFSPEGLKAGRAALDKERCRSADAIFVDEVGKLEADGLGWAPLLSPLLELSDSIHIWIVREQVLGRICRRWPVTATSVVRVDAPAPLRTLLSLIVQGTSS